MFKTIAILVAILAATMVTAAPASQMMLRGAESTVIPTTVSADAEDASAGVNDPVAAEAFTHATAVAYRVHYAATEAADRAAAEAVKQAAADAYTQHQDAGCNTEAANHASAEAFSQATDAVFKVHHAATEAADHVFAKAFAAAAYTHHQLTAATAVKISQI